MQFPCADLNRDKVRVYVFRQEADLVWKHQNKEYFVVFALVCLYIFPLLDSVPFAETSMPDFWYLEWRLINEDKES